MDDEPVGGELPGGAAGTFEDEPLGLGQPALFGKGADRRLERPPVEVARVEGQRRTASAMAASFAGSTSIATTVAPNAAAICTA